MVVFRYSGKPGGGMSFRRFNFAGAFWRGLGYRAARAAWATCGFLGGLVLVLIGVAWLGRHLHRVVGR